MDWKGIVRTVAPALGTALLGPFGGMATTAIAEAILPNDEVSELKKTPAKLEKAVQQAVLGGSPETLKALQEANNAFETRMAELGVDLERVHAEDRDSARKREAKTGDSTPQRLAFCYTLGFFTVLAALFAYGNTLDEAVADILKIMLGALMTCVSGIKDYYFGSSSSSAEKNVLLQKRVEL